MNQIFILLPVLATEIETISKQIHSLFAVLIILLLLFLVLKILLHHFQKKNSVITEKRAEIVEGQIGYVYTAIMPPEKGFIILETDNGIQFKKAVADAELEEGTAIVVISVEEDACMIKPLVSRV